MKKYIGTKQIEAEPMTMGEAYKVADTPLDKQFMEEMWLAMDKNGSLYFHGISKPEKDTGEGMWISDNHNPYPINPESFPEVQWSDEEPTKVKLVIEK